MFEVTSLLRRNFLTYTDNIEIAKSLIKLLISDQYERMDSFEAFVEKWTSFEDNILKMLKHTETHHN